MKGILTVVGIVAVGAAGVYLYKKTHEPAEIDTDNVEDTEVPICADFIRKEVNIRR